MKTIRKLGFKVSAVWNGKEALDHVLASDSPDSQIPKPDVILMDVQMPVLDGYRATHMLRHHEPYRMVCRDIPILAMTASAIQGDRERCEHAGMNDYVAKPVKGTTLEKMLVRWVTRKQTHGMSLLETVPEDHGSDCDEINQTPVALTSHPQEKEFVTGGGKNLTRSPTLPQKPVRPPLSMRTNSHSLTLPGPESEGDRAVRRSQAEEKATFLRDSKLLGAAGGTEADRIPHFGGSVSEGSEGQKLTKENVDKLENRSRRTVSSNDADDDNNDGDDDDDDDDRRSMDVMQSPSSLEKSMGTATTDSEDPSPSPQRPGIKRWRDLEMTVTGT